MRLIDADALKQVFYFGENDMSILGDARLDMKVQSIIDNAPTIETSYDLYREETCERKAHCYDYKYWHCIGCHGCKADVRGEGQ